MTGLHWFILAAIVMAALAYMNWKRTQGQVAQLERAGFVVSENLKGQPQLLVDTSHRELAVVDADRYRRLPFDAVVGAEYRFDAGRQLEINFRIEIALSNGDQLEIRYENEWLAQEQTTRLRTLLGL